MRLNPQVEAVKLSAHGHWGEILQGCCGLSSAEVNPKKKNLPCVICGGRDRYSYMSNEDGRFFCRQCTPRTGDGLDLIMKRMGCHFLEAVGIVAGFLGIEQGAFQSPGNLERLEQARIKREKEQARAQQAEQRQKQIAEKLVAESVSDILAKARPGSPAHHYLIRKKLPPLGLYQKDNLLLCPLYGEGHQLVNIEHITPSGKKFGLAGGRRKGVYHRFGEESWTVYICEGWATGASLYLLEQQSIRVYAAMGKNNLEAVALIAKQQNPCSRFVIAADNDFHQPGNPGLMGAVKAAGKVSGSIMWVDQKGYASNGVDFSDLYLAGGVSG